ncbi:hypothetical protein VL73_62 [Erwinia phage VL73]
MSDTLFLVVCQSVFVSYDNGSSWLISQWSKVEVEGKTKLFNLIGPLDLRALTGGTWI